MIKNLLLLCTLALVAFNSCDNTYDGPGPKTPTCFEFPMTDSAENVRGIVRLKDTSYYISNYVDETSDTRYFPCAMLPQYIKEGFPIEYSGRLRNRSGDLRQYIELTYVQPILNETIITDYKGYIRFRDSTKIETSEKTGIIEKFKIENYKFKFLLNYSACTKGRTYFITLYKTIQTQGVTTVYGYLTSPYEPCPTPQKLWYEIDASQYKDTRFVIKDGLQTFTFDIPE